MKLRPFLILLLFVVSAGVLVWIYYAATTDHPEPNKSVWAETISDLDACSRRKHVKAAQYDHFSNIAETEKHPAAARLFRAMAQSERLQEHNCATAILRLGGTYLPPSKVIVFKGTTFDNMDRSIAYERQSLSDLNGEEIDRALTRNNRYAARVLIWASAGDLTHLLLMERCKEHEQKRTKGSAAYLVCPSCGNTYEAEYANPFCPLCLTDGKSFIRFE